MTLTADVFGTRPQTTAESGERKRESQATAIVRLALEAGVELWHTPTGDGHITIAVGGHHEHHPLASRGTRDYLTRLYYFETGKAPNATAMQAAVATLSGIARFDGAEHDVHVRVGGANGRIYLDLCDQQWRAVEITAHGWQVVGDPPWNRVRVLAGNEVFDGAPYVQGVLRFLEIDSVTLDGKLSPALAVVHRHLSQWCNRIR